MATVTVKIQDCRDKVSPKCTKTFQLSSGRGRPSVNCVLCREFSKAGPAKAPKAPKKTVVEQATERSIECPCGKSFTVAVGGRGRKPSKCVECREAGIVYRANDDGMMEAIRAETLAEEAREIREQAGKDRAERLVMMMGPIIRRDAERRSKVAG